MYLSYFQFNKEPFALTPNTAFFCDLPAHRDALSLLLATLETGEGFIKIIGEVGVGKTLVCRQLLNQLPKEQYQTCYLPNPSVSPDELKAMFLAELKGKKALKKTDQMQQINSALLDYAKAKKTVVLLIDEAQALSDECLELLRLFSNLETESKKLLQIVLFAQPELDWRLNQHHFRQLSQRITTSYKINPLTKEGVARYLSSRLVCAGHQHGQIFQKRALDMLYKKSQGVPRVINILAHKALLLAYAGSSTEVDRKMVEQAVLDSQDVVRTVLYYRNKPSKVHFLFWSMPLVCAIAVMMAWEIYHIWLLR